MADEMGLSFPSLRSELMTASAQHGLACWSRAWTQMAQGLMAASVKQLELTRTLYATNPAKWITVAQPGNPHDAALDGLHTAKASFDKTMQGYRHINDELVGSLFMAAESLVDGLSGELPGGAGNPETAANGLSIAAKSPVTQAVRRSA